MNKILLLLVLALGCTNEPVAPQHADVAGDWVFSGQLNWPADSLGTYISWTDTLRASLVQYETRVGGAAEWQYQFEIVYVDSVQVGSLHLDSLRVSGESKVQGDSIGIIWETFEGHKIFLMVGTVAGDSMSGWYKDIFGQGVWTAVR